MSKGGIGGLAVSSQAICPVACEFCYSLLLLPFQVVRFGWLSIWFLPASSNPTLSLDCPDWSHVLRLALGGSLGFLHATLFFSLCLGAMDSNLKCLLHRPLLADLALGLTGGVLMVCFQNGCLFRLMYSVLVR